MYASEFVPPCAGPVWDVRVDILRDAGAGAGAGAGGERRRLPPAGPLHAPDQAVRRDDPAGRVCAEPGGVLPLLPERLLPVRGVHGAEPAVVLAAGARDGRPLDAPGLRAWACGGLRRRLQQRPGRVLPLRAGAFAVLPVGLLQLRLPATLRDVLLLLLPGLRAVHLHLPGECGVLLHQPPGRGRGGGHRQRPADRQRDEVGGVLPARPGEPRPDHAGVEPAGHVPLPGAVCDVCVPQRQRAAGPGDLPAERHQPVQGGALPRERGAEPLRADAVRDAAPLPVRRLAERAGGAPAGDVRARLQASDRPGGGGAAVPWARAGQLAGHVAGDPGDAVRGVRARVRPRSDRAELRQRRRRGALRWELPRGGGADPRDVRRDGRALDGVQHLLQAGDAGGRLPQLAVPRGACVRDRGGAVRAASRDGHGGRDDDGDAGVRVPGRAWGRGADH
eukprot:767179-Hanusia_phi.AAC.4